MVWLMTIKSVLLTSPPELNQSGNNVKNNKALATDWSNMDLGYASG